MSVQSLSNEELLAALEQTKGIGAQVDAALPHLIQQESGGRAGVMGPQTPYGRAVGRTQMLPATAKGVAEAIGEPYRPELLSGTSPEAIDYQDRLGRAYLTQGLEKTGNIQDAFKYYHGGPNKELWGPKTQAYAQQVSGRMNGEAQGVQAMSDADLLAALGDQAAPAPAPTMAPAPSAPYAPPRKVSEALGFAQGFTQPIAKAQTFIDAIPGGDLIGFRSNNTQREALKGMNQWFDKLGQTREPGKIGEFVGNVAATLPTGSMGPVVGGLTSGAMLSQKTDPLGIMKDAAIGAVTGKVADKAFKGIGKVAADLLSKAPKVMKLPELETAYKAAYQKVDQSGFRFSKTNALALADDLEKIVKDRGGKALYPDAWNMAQRAKTLASQKGGLPITQLEDLRGQMYDYLVSGGGKEAGLGGAMRSKIDDLISKEASQNALLRDARDLYKRFSKARAVTNRLDSADLQAGRAYTGKNVNNAIRQKLSPLVDPLSKSRMKNATADEAAALKQAVNGSPMQNLVRTTGSLLDPRGLLGMGLQAGGFATSGGMSLAAAPLGMAATAAGNRLSQKNVENLVRLIAAGGSKKALAKAPTAASRAAERAMTAARPAASVAAVAAIPRKKDRK